MKTKGNKHRIGVISLGCSKNLVDSELLLRQLEANNIEFVHDTSDLSRIDSAIINTCGFIHDARKESVETILQFVNAKQQRAIRKIFVMGCLSERYRDELRKELPEVDAFFGVNELEQIVSHLGGTYRRDLLGDRLLTTPDHFAYLKIAEGCDRRCSFCAIPAIRGKHLSRPIEDIVREARDLVKKGVREINLISQETSNYGTDLYKKRLLPELLESLAVLPGLEWIRLHYTFPVGFPMNALEVMKNHENLCNYIDIPLQHVSDRILKSMRRGTTADAQRKLIDRIRKTVPEAAIRTTFIVGYPGETEKEFNELVEFVRSVQFDRMGVFSYSHEEGTHAFRYRDSVPHRVKQQRVEEIMAIQESISLKLNEQRVGSVMKVIIDRKENDFFIGRTEYDSPEVDNEVIIDSHGQPLESGTFRNVRIIRAESFDLYAELV